LIWINGDRRRLDYVLFMPRNPRLPIRHCPLCGIAMQASKSDASLGYYDRFECLACNTTIELPQRSRGREARPSHTVAKD